VENISLHPTDVAIVLINETNEIRLLSGKDFSVIRKISLKKLIDQCPSEELFRWKLQDEVYRWKLPDEGE